MFAAKGVNPSVKEKCKNQFGGIFLSKNRDKLPPRIILTKFNKQSKG